MRVRTLLGSLLSALAACLLFAGSPANARVAPQCESVVIDNAHIFSNGDVAKVEAAANEVNNQGAVVHVVTERSIAGYGNNLDKYVHSLEAQCTSWQAVNGGRKNNLVVLAISFEPKSAGIYTGAKWNSSVAQQADTIRAEQMNPQFRDKNFAQGFVDGLGTIRERIYSQTHPQAVQPQTPAEPSKPMDLSWLGTLVLWLASGAIGIFLLVWGSRVFSRSRKAKAERLSMQQKAIQERAELENNILGLNALQGDLEFNISVLSGKLSASDMSQANALLKEFHAAHSQASTKYGSIQAQDPARELFFEQYEQITATAEEGNEAADKANEVARTLNQEIRHFEQMIDKLPTQITQTQQALEQAKISVTAVQQSGFKTQESDKLLVQTQKALDSAQTAAQAKLYSEANTKLAEAAELSRKAASTADSLPAVQKSLVDELAKLRLEHAGLTATDIPSSKNRLQELSAKYASSSLQSVKNNAAHAEKLCATTESYLSKANSSLISQDWEQTKNLLKEARETLKQSRELLEQIQSLSSKLETAKARVVEDSKTVFSGIKETENFVSQHRDDIKNVSPQLTEARKRLAQAQEELKKDKPDYLAVTSLLATAGQVTEKASSTAHRQYEEAENKRAKAARKLREAKERVSEVRSYVRSHSSRIDSSTERRLENLESSLSGLNTTNSLMNLVLLQQILQDADDVHSDARSSVDSYSSYDYGGSSYGSSSYNSGSSSDSSGSWGGYSSGSDSSSGWDSGSSSGSDSSGGW